MAELIRGLEALWDDMLSTVKQLNLDREALARNKIVAEERAKTLKNAQVESEPQKKIDFGQSYIEHDALPTVVDILERIVKHRGWLGAQEDWFKNIYPPHPVIFEHDANLSRANAAEVVQAIATRDSLKSVSRALSEIAECINFQATASEEYVNALVLRTGMSSLPDEVLAVVLEEAASPDSNGCGDHADAVMWTVKAAISLSHTCQRFRRIIFHIITLWSRVSNGMPSGMVLACCDRLSIASADVVVSYTSRKSPRFSVQEFTEIMETYSTHWDRLSFYHPWGSPLGDVEIEDLEALHKIKLDAPSLSELRIDHDPTMGVILDNFERYQELIHFYATWMMPKLSIFKATNMIPMPFASSSSLRAFSLSMDLEGKDLESGILDLHALVAFLASCTALERMDIDLKLVHDTWATEVPRPTPSRTLLSSVREVALSFRCCNNVFIKSFMDAIYLPFASSLKLWLQGNYRDEEGDVSEDISDSIFPDISSFPNLLELDISVSESGSTTYDAYSQVFLPFASLTKITHLSLSTYDTVLAPIPDGICLPALRTLTLKSCFRLEKRWIALFLGRLERNGHFQLSQLSVQRCYWRQWRDILTGIIDGEADEAIDMDNALYVPVTADEMRRLEM